MRYDPKETEAKWQTLWDQSGDFSVDTATAQRPYYVLEMFPYPSGKIHMGHVRNYVIGDVMARFARAKGYDVLHPMGWDAFGLPAENAAIERGVAPGDWTLQNIAAMQAQLKKLGLSYDWNRSFATCDPDYYRHEQAFFLDFYQRGLAYRRESWVNWDPVEQTVLANEQVVDGKGWRSGAPIEKKKLAQWFLKITDYNDALLSGLSDLKDWPEAVTLMQKNWIGKSSGAHIDFDLVHHNDTITVFSTRPETMFGAAFVAIAPHHPLAEALAKTDAGLAAFIADCDAAGTSEAAIESQDKKGYDTGVIAVHPLGGADIPVYVANFVLMDYGTGAVFGCPAHDARDHAFAEKYGLPIRRVVAGEGALPYTDPEGVMVDSDFLNGLSVPVAKEAAIEKLESLGKGSRKITYRLRDWGVSRQRYWGCPIPIIYCPDCGVVPVPKEHLPVTLPRDVVFSGGGNPLASHPTWKHVACPQCGGQAERETDTFDTFFESSWYFFRYITPQGDPFAQPEVLKRWLPVNHYIGGIEHAVMHLLYARFFTLALNTVGLSPVTVPFQKLLTQGMVCHASYKRADGVWLYPEDVSVHNGSAQCRTTGQAVTVGRAEKMSKSKKNLVDPEAIIAAYGADTARLFVLSDTPPERDMEWSDDGLEGAWRYSQRVYRLVHKAIEAGRGGGSPPRPVLVLMNKTLRDVVDDLSLCHTNRAIARIREFSNALEALNPDTPNEQAGLWEGARVLLMLLSPFMPHLAEDLWAGMGGATRLSKTHWPTPDPAYLHQSEVTLAVQINGKRRGEITVPTDADVASIEQMALNDPQILPYLAGQTVKKIIVVPGRIVSVVV
ncbi:MAG: leucine--tRNA ligase [Alphaproteobacteria bacterium]